MGTNFLLRTTFLIPSLLIFVLCCSCFLLEAQQGSNPFDLSPRLSSAQEATTDSAIATGSNNPFDIVAPRDGETAPRSTQKAAPKPAKPRRNISEVALYRRFLFVSIMSTLLLLTLLMTFLRPFYQKSYSAFGNGNMFNQVLRESDSAGRLPFVILYSFFFVNIGLFVYLLLLYYKINILFSGAHYLNWLICSITVAGIFLFKHSVLFFTGAIFPVWKETRAYNFLIIIFGIVIGIILVPVNFLVAYGPENVTIFLIYFASGTLALVYAFRCFRGLIIANRFIAFHKFHFLLYLCTVEIAPVLFLVKLLFRQI